VEVEVEGRVGLAGDIVSTVSRNHVRSIGSLKVSLIVVFECRHDKRLTESGAGKNATRRVLRSRYGT